MPRPSNHDVYVGVCDDVIRSKRSDEDPLNISIFNSKNHFYSKEENDKTTIKVSGSASYPFLEILAPNIDFELKIELHKKLFGEVHRR